MVGCFVIAPLPTPLGGTNNPHNRLVGGWKGNGLEGFQTLSTLTQSLQQIGSVAWAAPNPSLIYCLMHFCVGQSHSNWQPVFEQWASILQVGLTTLSSTQERIIAVLGSCLAMCNDTHNIIHMELFHSREYMAACGIAPCNTLLPYSFKSNFYLMHAIIIRSKNSTIKTLGKQLHCEWITTTKSEYLTFWWTEFLNPISNTWLYKTKCPLQAKSYCTTIQYLCAPYGPFILKQ